MSCHIIKGKHFVQNHALNKNNVKNRSKSKVFDALFMSSLAKFTLKHITKPNFQIVFNHLLLIVCGM